MNTAFQFMRFVVTGVTSTAVDFLVLHLLVRFGVAQFVAVAAAFLVGLLVNLVMHKFFTFRDPSPLRAAQLARFLALVAVNLATTEAVIWWATSVAGLSVYAGKLLSLPPVLAVGFTLSRRWVFAPPRRA